MTDLAPIGPYLATRNRRLFAQRGGWPDGALDACEILDAECPGWTVYWSRGPVGDSRPGFYAIRDRETVYAADAAVLAGRLALIPVPDRGLGPMPPLTV
jgi:hypothetical protein